MCITQLSFLFLQFGQREEMGSGIPDAEEQQRALDGRASRECGERREMERAVE